MLDVILRVMLVVTNLKHNYINMYLGVVKRVLKLVSGIF